MEGFDEFLKEVEKIVSEKKDVLKKRMMDSDRARETCEKLRSEITKLERDLENAEGGLQSNLYQKGVDTERWMDLVRKDMVDPLEEIFNLAVSQSNISRDLEVKRRTLAILEGRLPNFADLVYGAESNIWAAVQQIVSKRQDETQAKVNDLVEQIKALQSNWISEFSRVLDCIGTNTTVEVRSIYGRVTVPWEDEILSSIRSTAAGYAMKKQF